MDGLVSARNSTLIGHTVSEIRHGVCCLLVPLALAACTGDAEYLHFGGATMGTQYQITARCESREQALRSAVTSELDRVNASASTYDPDSELSRFNAAPTGEWFSISEDLLEVVVAALLVSEQTAGAFDITVGPLVNLWGFGPGGSSADLKTAQNSDTLQSAGTKPDVRAVQTAMQQVGYQSLEFRTRPPALRKDKSLYVDLSAIAKGWGVDRLADLLASHYCTDFLVDVGGEVRVRGISPRGAPWRVGVEMPDSDQWGGVQKVLTIVDMAVATSGDYRNFIEIDGRRFSHTINPQTGSPVDHALASVTVVHPLAMWADAYATALNVLGPEEGLAFAERHDLAVYLIVHVPPSGFEERYTPGMSHFFADVE